LSPTGMKLLFRREACLLPWVTMFVRLFHYNRLRFSVNHD